MKNVKLLLVALGAISLIASSQAAEVANSISEFSTDGTQGTDGWTYGYRNYTVDGGGEDYDPDTEFIPFVNADHWRGALWRLVESGAPWTTIEPVLGHPGGDNNGEEHWAIRRWAAEATGPVAVTWSVSKTAATNDGVSGSLHHEGAQVDTAAVATTAGVTRTYFLNVTVGERIDLALTPVGVSGDRGDGNDGSSFSFTVNDEVNDLETQPDGAFFIASDAVDSDGDNLADAWEEFYFQGDLDALNGDGVADSDGDGLSDLGEQQNSTNPTLGDTDMDGLTDFEEIDSAGTNPNNPDSDGDCVTDGDEVNLHMTDPLDTDSDDDTYSDYEEIASFSDPNDDADNPLVDLVGDSVAEWSGVQGANDWSYGYRNYTADGGGENYGVGSGFIAFAGGSAGGAWDGTAQQWNNNNWDLNTAAAAPWTFLAETNTHPNSENNGGEHWTIRRWTASELTTVTPLAITWHARKANTANDGVSGSLHLGGQQLDKVTIAGSDTKGVIRTVFANVSPNGKIDIALSPEGLTNRSDGSDSSHTWMRISTRIPADPVQPDGTPFVPATGADSDADGLPDEYEFGFFPGDLTQLSGLGGADKDMDGSTDAAEFLIGSDPTDDDSDDDGLKDGVETNDGNFVDENATGTSPIDPDSDGDSLNDKEEFDGTLAFITNPTLTDTDGDGLSDSEEYALMTDPTDDDSDDDTYLDGAEVARMYDPNDPLSNPGTIVADSFMDFSGNQGVLNWTNGYRNFTDDPSDIDYDAAADFIAFVGGPDDGAYDPITQQWNANRWDLAASGAPWTEVGAENLHPNGSNNTSEMWPIRRWVANDIAESTPFGLTWHTRKANLNGSGVTGSLHINGAQVDTLAVAGNDGTGVVRTWFANVQPGDIVDLALTPVGPDGDSADGADGSVNWLRIDSFIPPGAQQPDGTPFSPAAANDFRITVASYDANSNQFSVTWVSTPGRRYSIESRNDLTTGVWAEEVEEVTADGPTTSESFSFFAGSSERRFVRVLDITDRQ